MSNNKYYENYARSYLLKEEKNDYRDKKDVEKRRVDKITNKIKAEKIFSNNESQNHHITQNTMTYHNMPNMMLCEYPVYGLTLISRQGILFSRPSRYIKLDIS